MEKIRQQMLIHTSPRWNSCEHFATYYICAKELYILIEYIYTLYITICIIYYV